MREEGKNDLGPFATTTPGFAAIGPPGAPSYRYAVVFRAIGPVSVPILGLRDGFVVFEFHKSPNYSGGSVPAYKLDQKTRKIPKDVGIADRNRMNLSYERHKYMNAFVAALGSAIIEIQKSNFPTPEPITPDNYFAASLEDSGWEIAIPLGYNSLLPRRANGPVTLKTMEKAVETLNNAYSLYSVGAFEVLSLLLVAASHYCQHQFSSSHIISWSIVEFLLNRMWSEFQDKADEGKGGHTAFNKGRRKKLSGREYTASVITQMLSLSGVIDDSLLERLDACRSKRNDFLHELGGLNSDDATKCIQLASDMLSQQLETRIVCPLQLSSTDFTWTFPVQ